MKRLRPKRDARIGLRSFAVRTKQLPGFGRIAAPDRRFLLKGAPHTCGADCTASNFWIFAIHQKIVEERRRLLAFVHDGRKSQVLAARA